jgi:hypothetical protein
VNGTACDQHQIGMISRQTHLWDSILAVAMGSIFSVTQELTNTAKHTPAQTDTDVSISWTGG